MSNAPMPQQDPTQQNAIDNANLNLLQQQQSQGTGSSNNFGGYAGGANDFAAYTQGLGAEAGQRQAPQTNLMGVDALRGVGLQGQAAQQQGLAQLQQAAAGGGPGATAATTGYNAATNQSMLGALGGLSTAGAGAAIGANSGAASQAMQQSVAQRAQAAGQAAGQFNAGAAGLTQSANAQGTTDLQTAQNVADIQAQQNAINQQGQLQFQSLGQGAEEAQLQAATSGFNANAGWVTNQQQLAGQSTMNNINMGLGALTGAGGWVAGMAKGNGSPQVESANPPGVTPGGYGLLE